MAVRAFARPMDPKVGDHVRFKHKRVEITGTVIKRSGARIRVQPEDGGATLWKELSELLPLAPVVDEASEVAELQRLFQFTHLPAARPMDPKEGDYVRVKHKRVEITGSVIKRSGTHVRVQPKDGGATLWKELSELLPLAPVVDEASEVADPVSYTHLTLPKKRIV